MWIRWGQGHTVAPGMGRWAVQGMGHAAALETGTLGCTGDGTHSGTGNRDAWLYWGWGHSAESGLGTHGHTWEQEDVAATGDRDSGCHGGQGHKTTPGTGSTQSCHRRLLPAQGCVGTPSVSGLTGGHPATPQPTGLHTSPSPSLVALQGSGKLGAGMGAALLPAGPKGWEAAPGGRQAPGQR